MCTFAPMKRLSRRIYAERKAQGISQKDLARKANISVVTLNGIEQGNDTKLSTIQAIEQALNVTLY